MFFGFLCRWQVLFAFRLYLAIERKVVRFVTSRCDSVDICCHQETSLPCRCFLMGWNNIPYWGEYADEYCVHEIRETKRKRPTAKAFQMVCFVFRFGNSDAETYSFERILLLCVLSSCSCSFWEKVGFHSICVVSESFMVSTARLSWQVFSFLCQETF